MIFGVYHCEYVIFLVCLCKSLSLAQDSISTCKESTSLHNRHFKSSISSTSGDFAWKPLVLFIPLRLGLSTMNLVYENALKVISFHVRFALLDQTVNFNLEYVSC